MTDVRRKANSSSKSLNLNAEHRGEVVDDGLP